MRGTPGERVEHASYSGIIPAYAGNTYFALFCFWVCRDHPRVCGEHRSTRTIRCVPWGSSPRMRGTPSAVRGFRAPLWIIPAYAGNTILSHAVGRSTWDHPRVCGEHRSTLMVSWSAWGSSPRMRGTPVFIHSWIFMLGIIPAYAGNTKSPSTCWVTSRDHPRVCGEHAIPSLSHLCLAGSSPRMRGTPCVCEWSDR